LYQLENVTARARPRFRELSAASGNCRWQRGRADGRSGDRKNAAHLDAAVGALPPVRGGGGALQAGYDVAHAPLHGLKIEGVELALLASSRRL
jgi:hypothetical protein